MTSIYFAGRHVYSNLGPDPVVAICALRTPTDRDAFLAWLHAHRPVLDLLARLPPPGWHEAVPLFDTLDEATAHFGILLEFHMDTEQEES